MFYSRTYDFEAIDFDQIYVYLMHEFPPVESLKGNKKSDVYPP